VRPVEQPRHGRLHRRRWRRPAHDPAHGLLEHGQTFRHGGEARGLDHLARPEIHGLFRLHFQAQVAVAEKEHRVRQPARHDAARPDAPLQVGTRRESQQPPHGHHRLGKRIRRRGARHDDFRKRRHAERGLDDGAVLVDVHCGDAAQAHFGVDERLQIGMVRVVDQHAQIPARHPEIEGDEVRRIEHRSGADHALDLEPLVVGGAGREQMIGCRARGRKRTPAQRRELLRRDPRRETALPQHAGHDHAVARGQLLARGRFRHEDTKVAIVQPECAARHRAGHHALEVDRHLIRRRSRPARKSLRDGRQWLGGRGLGCEGRGHGRRQAHRRGEQDKQEEHKQEEERRRVG